MKNDKLKMYYILSLIMVLIAFIECSICLNLFLNKMELDNKVGSKNTNYIRYKYGLSMGSIHELQRRMRLDILYEGKGDILSYTSYTPFPSDDTEDLINKFISNISEIYIDYRDDGAEENYKPLIGILGLDKNFEGNIEFKINRIIQSLSYGYIQEGSYYVAGDNNVEGIDGIDLIQSLGRLNVQNSYGRIKSIKCYRKDKGNDYIEIEESKAFKYYFWYLSYYAWYINKRLLETNA